MSPKDRAEKLGPKKLGPDALLVTAEQMRERLGKSRSAIKVALLDQKAIAGVGNLYASELLHMAKIHPAKRCDRITKQQWSSIKEAMRCVLEGSDPVRGVDVIGRNVIATP